ncbi:phage tail protein [Pseudomonas aeruginosa]|uniref:phage tail protein n=1 Tax=Pseudomonas aeruginosa TaxID=287 RepID=UPI003D2FD780
MIDQNSQFFAILTEVGAAKQANADALGIPWKLTQMGVGDANGTDPIPSAAQTKLINERRRAPLNQLKVDPNNAAVIIAEQIIPENIGGWWIREIGLYDADNDLVAVANCAPSFKPILSQGSGITAVSSRKGPTRQLWRATASPTRWPAAPMASADRSLRPRRSTRSVCPAAFTPTAAE